MRYSVPKFEGLLQRIASKVEIAILRTQVLAAVALVFDREGRGETFVEDIYFGNADFNVAGRHFCVFAAALHHFALRLDYEFTPQGGRGFHQFGGSIGFDHQLGNPVTVAQVYESHSAEFT